jgi:hypothetical protein
MNMDTAASVASAKCDLNVLASWSTEESYVASYADYS